MNEVVIQRAESIHDYRACQEAQRLAWGIRDASYLVPVATMVGAQLHGGLVLGAFRPDGSAVAMSFAFLGKIEGRIGLYSQITGVVPEYQSMGLGRRLKDAQRAYCRDQGLPVMAWSFDPFQSGNARFNLMKLGATATRFVPDMYGLRSDELNAGAPTDRLIVEWGVEDTERPSPSESDLAGIPSLIGFDDDNQPVYVPRGEARVRVEIPRTRNDRWRSAVCEAFLLSFGEGYRATAYVELSDPNGPRGVYLLEKPPLSGENLVDHASADIGETEVAALKTVDQALVIDA